MIAVLPFESLSPDPEEFYLGAGLADAITTRLSRSQALTVRPMSTVMEAILDRPSPAVAAGRLQAGVILQGSCAQTAGIIRARVKLVNAITGAGIWERDFQTGVEGRGPIDEEIVNQTLSSVVPGFAGRTDPSQTAESGDRQIARYLYLLARGRLADYETHPLREAIHLLERATTTEPAFEPAYAALAEVSTNMFLGGLSPDRIWIARGIAAGRKAVEIDPADPAAHFSLGYALLFAGEPVQAVREVLAALRINRSHPDSLRLMSALLSQAGAARPARSLRDRAARLDPSLASGWSDVYLAAAEGHMAETVNRLEQEIESRRAAGRPTEIPVQTLGFLAFETGDPTAGLRWAAMLEQLSDNAVYSDLVRLLAFARMGDVPAVRSILERGKPAYWEDWEYSLWIARALALVGERHESLIWLSRCAELGGYDASALKRGGFFSELGDDPVYRKAEFDVTTRARQIIDLAASEGYL